MEIADTLRFSQRNCEGIVKNTSLSSLFFEDNSAGGKVYQIVSEKLTVGDNFIQACEEM